MKKLFVLVLVLAITSMAMAATVDLQIVAGPAPQGTDPGSGAPSYLPSDTITIALVAAGFGTGATDGVGAVKFDYATRNPASSDGGTGASPDLHSKLKGELYYVGTVQNSGSSLIYRVDGSLLASDYTGIDAGNLWQFDFHVPDVDHSSIITIAIDGLDINNKFGGDLTYTYGGSLEIHVTPEPMTIALLGLGGLFLRRRK